MGRCWKQLLTHELNAAFYILNLNIQKSNIKRLKLWNRYFLNLKNISQIQLPYIPNDIKHNGHLFFIKVKDIVQRQNLMDYLNLNMISTAFHYIPLSESEKCNMYFEFKGDNKFTSIESQRLLRLPIYFDLEIKEVDYICKKIKSFFND